MTEAIRKVLPPEYAALAALLSSIFTTVYSAGHQAATIEAQARDIARLERTVRYLDLRVRRSENWPSRAAEPSMKTDQQ